MQTASNDGATAPEDAQARAQDADYGVGVDSELVARWRERLPSLRRSHRLFTAREREYCDRFADPAPVYAGSWCAKEAVFKAVSRFGSLTVDQIEIERLATGCPEARLPTALAERVSVHVSITHDAERAVAFAVAVVRGASAGESNAIAVIRDAADAGCARFR
jgi:phosphopantetheine--protein transferase-like protein